MKWSRCNLVSWNSFLYRLRLKTLVQPIFQALFFIKPIKKPIYNYSITRSAFRFCVYMHCGSILSLAEKCIFILSWNSLSYISTPNNKGKSKFEARIEAQHIFSRQLVFKQILLSDRYLLETDAYISLLIFTVDLHLFERLFLISWENNRDCHITMPLSLKTMEVQIKGDQWNKRCRIARSLDPFFVSLSDKTDETYRISVSYIKCVSIREVVL